ncbi:MAG TPA: hypothetical protein VGL51_10135 [Solirubrobacteraceae bacterium]|jgi:hypothetical protein
MDFPDRHRTRQRRFGGRHRRLGVLLIAASLTVIVALGWRDSGRVPSGRAEPVTQIQRTAQSGSAWNRPALVDPTTIVVDAAHNNLVLDQSKDYILRLTPGVDSMRIGLTVWGGRNVVIDGGHLNVTGHSGGMELKNQAGTIWIHDLHISGGSRLMEGIDLQEPMPGATVVLRDVLVDKVHGSYTTNHADLIQTWAGPSRLLIDGFTGTTGYQGFFLLPNQLFRGPSPKIFDLRNIDIDDSRGAYALWLSDQHGPFPLHVQDVVIKANPVRTWRGWWLWGFKGQDSNAPGKGTWAAVSASKTLAPRYVHATPWGASGIDEVVAPPALSRERR